MSQINSETKTLIANLPKLHTTPLGAERIRRNLALTDADVMAWCRGLRRQCL